MLLAKDPNPGLTKELYHLVSEREPSPGGESITTLCLQQFVAREFQERLVVEFIDDGGVCLHCRVLFKRTRSTDG